MTVGFHNTLKNNNMDWIDKLNKELEERRNRNKTSEAQEEAKQRMRTNQAKVARKSSNGWVKGGKVSAEYNRKSGRWDEIRVLGAVPGGKSSGDKKSKIRDELYTKFLLELPSEFITSQAKEICKKYNYSNWKGFLKCEKFVIQIHKGDNQFNPSVYQKVK